MPSTIPNQTHSALALLAVPLGLGLLVALAGFLVRHYGLGWLERLAARSKTGLPRLFLGSLKMPSLLWCVALGVAAGLEAAPLPPRLEMWGTRLLAALVLLSITFVTADAASRYLQYLAQQRRLAMAVTGLGTGLTKILVFLLGGLVILETLGVAIPPLVAALGVGGIAVALALQDILSNLFAGVYLLAEKPVRVGDFVKLETGHEGTVADIGWRTTQIRVPNSTIIVPNAKLAQGVLTVRDRAEARPARAAVGGGNHPERA